MMIIYFFKDHKFAYLLLICYRWWCLACKLSLNFKSRLIRHRVVAAGAHGVSITDEYKSSSSTSQLENKIPYMHGNLFLLLCICTLRSNYIFYALMLFSLLCTSSVSPVTIPLGCLQWKTPWLKFITGDILRRAWNILYKRQRNNDKGACALLLV